LTSVRGHRRGFTKVKTNRVWLDVDTRASNELLLAISQSFEDGHYSPLTGMEEKEWQIEKPSGPFLGLIVMSH
jgi:hypothetical protein